MSGIDTGDTAWMLVATALVLMMTPALGLFYAGLVRGKNTLNTFMMCIAALGVATVTWVLVGYSLAFDEGVGLIGGLDHALLTHTLFPVYVGALLWLFFLLRQPRPATAARTLLPVLGGGSRVPENAHSRQSGE